MKHSFRKTRSTESPFPHVIQITQEIIHAISLKTRLAFAEIRQFDNFIYELIVLTNIILLTVWSLLFHVRMILLLIKFQV